MPSERTSMKKREKVAQVPLDTLITFKPFGHEGDEGHLETVSISKPKTKRRKQSLGIVTTPKKASKPLTPKISKKHSAITPSIPESAVKSEHKSTKRKKKSSHPVS